MTTDRAALAHLRHELRTPLNHIIGYGEMLLEEIEPGGSAILAADLRGIHAHAQELLGLINDFLSPARVEAGAVDLAHLPAELAGPVDRILTLGQTLRDRAVAESASDLLPDVERICAAAERLRTLIAQGVAPPPAHDRAADGPAAGAVARQEPTAASAESARLLVVDDNEDNREMLARRLSRQGYATRVAASGRDALEALATEPVDLVLLDVMMPEMDGYEVLGRLKADPAWRDIPVLMISALDEIDSVVRCIELGAEDYLSKPFNPVLLRARIGACLEKKRLRDREVRHHQELAEWNRTLEQRVQEQVGQLERVGRLKRFFSPQLAELIVAGGTDDPLRTHRREITVVFLDLRGFTAFAETSEPEEVMGLLREYHAEMGTLILEYEGTLERFTGDGMMIFFNDPVPIENPAERAVRMALAMRDEVDTLAEGWRKQGHDLGLGIGIAQGYATIGAIGYEGRWDYGAIGTVTNLAARLCGEAKGGQILVSSRVAARVETLAACEEVGPLALKGLHKRVPVFNVVGLKPAG
jgi:class 3 adenylate cyclase